MTYKKCSVCDLPILESDTYVIRKKVNGKIEEEIRQNIAIEVKSLPTGYVHLQCLIKYDEQIVGSGRIKENLSQMAKEL